MNECLQRRLWWRNMSVRPSRRYSIKTAKRIVKLFSPSGSDAILVYRTNVMVICPDGDPLTGASNAGGMKNSDFRPISRFISNDTRLSHYGMRNRTQASERYAHHVRWPWRTHNPYFKVTPLFDAEYLRNCTSYRHSYNGILTGTYTRPAEGCHFKWSWVTLSDLAKYSMTRSIARINMRQLSFLFQMLLTSIAFCFPQRHALAQLNIHSPKPHELVNRPTWHIQWTRTATIVHAAARDLVTRLL